MKKNSKVSVAIHSLLHLALEGKPVTSEELGACQNTNPVLIRRILGKLKSAGVVDSEKGHGGGWVLLKDPKSISFKDIFSALEDSLLPAPMKLEEGESCLVLRTISLTMGEFLDEADKIIDKKLSKISIQSLINQIQ